MSETETSAQADLRRWKEGWDEEHGDYVVDIPSRKLSTVVDESLTSFSYQLSYYTGLLGTYDPNSQKACIKLNTRETYWLSALSPRSSYSNDINQQSLTAAVEALRQPFGGMAEITLTVPLPSHQAQFLWTPEVSPNYTDFQCQTLDDLQRFQPGALLWLACKQNTDDPNLPATLLTILKVTEVGETAIRGLCQTYSRNGAVSLGKPFLKTFLDCGGLIVGSQIPRRRNQVAFTRGRFWAQNRLWSKVPRNNRSQSPQAFVIQPEASGLDAGNVNHYSAYNASTPLLEPVEQGLILER